jgi:hypothetical protein
LPTNSLIKSGFRAVSGGNYFNPIPGGYRAGKHFQTCKDSWQNYLEKLKYNKNM